MSDLENRNPEEIEDLSLFFKKIVGVEVKFTEKLSDNEEDNFLLIMKRLEQSIELEELVLIHGGISVDKIVDPLWYVLENFIMMYYGEPSYELIMWYLFNRFDENGDVQEWEDMDGKTYKIETKKELWKFLTYNFLS